LSRGGSIPYTSTDKTNKNKYTQMNTKKNIVQTIQNTVNTGTHVYYPNTQTYTHPHITRQVKTTTVQDIPK